MNLILTNKKQGIKKGTTTSALKLIYFIVNQGDIHYVNL